MEKAKKHFENLMGYDYETALKKEWYKGTMK
jgi:hypothetical protein